MPFQSEKQRKWMWANKPEMAREWTEEYGSKIKAKTGTMAKKDKNWIQKATKNMRKDKPCTGKKFGSPTCPPGSRRYNLAKTFRKMAKKAGGGPIKAQDSKFIQKKKWWANPKKLKSLTDNLKADMQFISDAQAGKLSPALAEKAKKKVLKKSSAGQGSGYADEIRKIIKRKPSIVGDEAKGGPYKPGWKPQLSVRTAKRGIFNTGKKGMPPATKYKEYLRSMGKATSSKFPANAFTAGKTALGAQQLKAHLKTKLPKGATSTLSKAARIAKATRYGKIALGVAAAGIAAKEYLRHKSKNKVQKKATGGEIIIGKGVDIDLL